MIDLFKQKIQETKVKPELLKGTWLEASDILRSHFGKVSRAMVNNQKTYRLFTKLRSKNWNRFSLFAAQMKGAGAKNEPQNGHNKLPIETLQFYWESTMSVGLL